MKIKCFLLALLFSASAFAQCTSFVINPMTHKVDCVNALGASNATASSVGAVTSLAITHNLGTLNIVFSCFRTDTGATVAVTSISGQTTNAVTLNFASTPNVQCNVNGTGGGGGSGQNGAQGIPGPQGPAIVIGTTTLVKTGTDTAPFLNIDSTSVPQYFLSPTAPPTCSQGRDFFINTTNNRVYFCPLADNTWVPFSPGGVAGSLQFKSGNGIEGSANFTFDDTLGIFKLSHAGQATFIFDNITNANKLGILAGTNALAIESNKNFLWLGADYATVGQGFGAVNFKVYQSSTSNNYMAMMPSVSGTYPSLRCEGNGADTNVGCAFIGQNAAANSFLFGDGTMNGLAMFTNGILAPVAAGSVGTITTNNLTDTGTITANNLNVTGTLRTGQNTTVLSAHYVSGASPTNPTGTLNQTCFYSLTNGGGTNATVSVSLTGVNTIDPVTAVTLVTAPGLGYTSQPTVGAFVPGGTASVCPATIVVTSTVSDPSNWQLADTNNLHTLLFGMPASGYTGAFVLPAVAPAINGALLQMANIVTGQTAYSTKWTEAPGGSLVTQADNVSVGNATNPASGLFIKGTTYSPPTSTQFTSLCTGTCVFTVPNIAAGAPAVMNNGTLTLDMSATGGASQVLKQTSAGGAVTVARLACADLSDASATCATSGLNATNISSGTLAVARGGTGAAAIVISNHDSWCNGIISTTSNTTTFLVPGNTTTTACTATTNVGTPMALPAGGSCTARNLRVNLGAQGFQADSGTVTLYKSGSTTALTCAAGTTTSCVDTANTVAFSAGDLWSIGIKSGLTAGASETAASARVSFQCF